MASLNLIVAFDGPGANAKASVIYAGKDGQAARTALEKDMQAKDSKAYRYLVMRNPVGITKYNAKKVLERKAKQDAEEAKRAEAEARAAAAATAKAEAEKT